MRKILVCLLVIILCAVTGTSAAEEITTINPITDVLIGDNVTISGTTNASYVSVAVIFRPEYPKRMTSENIFVSDDGEMHNWSVELDGGLFNPGEYVVTANNRGWHPEPDRSTNMTVIMESRRQWIAIDPIPTQVQGSVLKISGTTGFEPHIQLYFEMLPVDRFFLEEEMRPVYSIRTFVYPVKGAEGENVWNVSVDTASFPPGKYIVRMAASGQNERAGLQLSIGHFSLTPEWEIYTQSPWLTISAMQEFVLTEPKIPAAPGFLVPSILIGCAAAFMLTRKR